jgi:NADP-dependent 3-hydroxy acid dehydrogenase YdfG
VAADGYDLIAVGRRKDRLDELAAEFPNVGVRPFVADLGTDAGVQAVADVCACEAIRSERMRAMDLLREADSDTMRRILRELSKK